LIDELTALKRGGWLAGGEIYDYSKFRDFFFEKEWLFVDTWP